MVKEHGDGMTLDQVIDAMIALQNAMRTQGIRTDIACTFLTYTVEGIYLGRMSPRYASGMIENVSLHVHPDWGFVAVPLLSPSWIEKGVKP